MRTQTIWSQVWAGTAFRYFKDALYEEQMVVRENVVENLEGFFEYLKEQDLEVTDKAAEFLRLFCKKIKKDKADHLSKEEAAELTELAHQLETTFTAEADLKVTYVLRGHRGYDVRKLIGEPGSLLATSAYDRLPAIAQHDFSSAARCLAFELGTATALHIMRCVEGVLREYLKAKTGAAPRGKTWGSLLEELRRSQANFPQGLLEDLDHLRKFYRNPTQHPDKIYDIDEAYDLFNVSVRTINQMIRDGFPTEPLAKQ